MDSNTIFFLIVFGAVWIFKQLVFDFTRKRHRNYYRNTYLKSNAWKRKRYVVLKRANWRCAYCGAEATQMHHKICKEEYRQRAH